MRHINENIKIMRNVDVDVEEKASNVVLVQRFSEIDDESFLGENSSADEGFEVPHSPFHFEAIQVDFVELIRWENDLWIRMCQELNLVILAKLLKLWWNNTASLCIDL